MAAQTVHASVNAPEEATGLDPGERSRRRKRRPEFPLGTSKHSLEFRADAVALYHLSPGWTYASVAKDPGCHPRDAPHVGAGCRAGCPARGGGGHRDGEGEPTAVGAGEGTRARAGDPAEGREVFCGGDQLVSSCFQFVEDHRGAFGVKRLCGTGAVRPVSQSSAGRPAATPANGTSASARSARSPTNSDQLRWPPPHDNRCPRSRGRPRCWVDPGV